MAVKRKNPSEGEQEIKTCKKLKIIFNGSSSQSLDTTTTAGVMKKCNNNIVKKERDDSLKSRHRSTDDQMIDKALPSRFTESETAEKVREGEARQSCTVLASQTDINRRVSNQGGCVEPTSTSEQSNSVLHITQEEGGLSERQAAKLKQKNKRMGRELREYVAKCVELNEDNKRIMDELKQVCHPYVIKMLEAKNPCSNHQT